MTFLKIAFALAIPLAVAASACAGEQASKAPPKDQAQAQAQPQAKPEWVSRGSRVTEHRLEAVGKSEGIKNPKLRQQTADNWARNELSKQYALFTSSFVERMNKALSALPPDPQPFDPNNPTQTLAGFVHWLDRGLDGLVIREQWDDGNGVSWTLATLDADYVRKYILSSKDLKEDRKPIIAKALDETFAELVTAR
jgi:hypothetical protein